MKGERKRRAQGASSRLFIATCMITSNGAQEMDRNFLHWCTRRPVLPVCLVIVVLSSAALAGPKTDIVIMKNGDHLTCDVKKLVSGVLYVDLDYVSGSTGLDWMQVESVRTQQGYQVVFKDGERVVGTFTKVPEKEAPGKDFAVNRVNGAVIAAAPDVVEIQKQKRNFWRQLTGALDFGFGFTSGNSQTQVNSDANVGYLNPKYYAGANFTSSFSGQPGTSQTNLVQVQTLDGVFLSRNSFLLGLGDFLHSSQQDLALRTTLGGGYGHYLVHSNRNVVALIAGAVYTHETFTAPTQPSSQNIEALLGATYQLFRFDRYNLQSQVLVYPGLSDAGRIRTTTKTTFTVKLPNNFHTNFSFWDNFDSKPPTGAKNNELGISNTLGWTF